MFHSPGFRMREIYGQHILMPVRRNPTGNDPIVLNDVGAVIWDAAPKCENPSDMLQVISQTYGLSAGSAEQTAVGAFIQQLITMKLITTVKPEAL